MERCPSDCRASDYHVSDGREADQGGDGQGRGAAPAAPTLGKVVCGHPLPITDLLGYIIIFASLGFSLTYAREKIVVCAVVLRRLFAPASYVSVPDLLEYQRQTRRGARSRGGPGPPHVALSLV